MIGKDFVYNMSFTMHIFNRKHIYLFSQEETPFVQTATHWITDIAATVPQMFNFILDYSSLILGQMDNSRNKLFEPFDQDQVFLVTYSMKIH